MFFYFGNIAESILFKQLNPETHGSGPNGGKTFGICLLGLTLAILHEFLKFSRQNWFWNSNLPQNTILQGRFNSTWFLNSSLYFFQTFLSYSIMLMCMYFNVWLIASICLGFAFGKFFFGLIPSEGKVDIENGEVGQETKTKTGDDCCC